jgi:hypothetical protein
VPSRLALVMILVIGEDAGIPRRLSSGPQAAAHGHGVLAATIKVGSNVDAELVGRGPVPLRDQRLLEPKPGAARA